MCMLDQGITRSHEDTLYQQWRIQDFPLGGGGAPTSDAYTFQQKRI